MKTVALCLLVIGSLSGIAMADEKVIPDFRPGKPSAELTAEETKLIALTNAERKKLELQPLQADPELMKIAQAHAANMARLDRLGHELEGQTFSQRMEKAKYQASRAGENVAQGQPTPEEAVADWMRSEGHKANILQTEYTHIGVGTAAAKSGQTYFTQVFFKPGNPVKPDKALPLEWRVLLIIKPETDLTLQDEPAIKTRIPKDNINAVKQAFAEHAP